MAAQFNEEYFKSLGFEDQSSKPAPSTLSQADIDSIKPRNKPLDEEYFKSQGFEDPSKESSQPRGLLDKILAPIKQEQQDTAKLYESGGSAGPLGIDVSPESIKYMNAPVVNISDRTGELMGQPTSTYGKIGKGVVQGAAQGLENLVTPQNLMLAPLAGVEGVGSLLTKIFAPQMAAGTYESGQQAYQDIQNKNPEMAANDITKTLMNAGMTYGLAKHGIDSMNPKIAAEAEAVRQNMAQDEALRNANQGNPLGATLQDVAPFELNHEVTPQEQIQQTPFNVGTNGRITVIRNPMTQAMDVPPNARAVVMDQEPTQLSDEIQEPAAEGKTIILRKKTPSGIPLGEPQKTTFVPSPLDYNNTGSWRYPQELLPQGGIGKIVSRNDAMEMPERQQGQLALPPPSLESRIQQVGEPATQGLEGLMDHGIKTPYEQSEETLSALPENPKPSQFADVISKNPELFKTIQETAHDLLENKNEQGLPPPGDTWFEDMKDKGLAMVQQYGAPGGALVDKTARGFENKQAMLQYAKPFIDEVDQLQKKYGFSGKDNKTIINALQDRENANKYLGNNSKLRTAYNNFKDIFSTFEDHMRQNGMAVRENYFTHMMEGDPHAFMESLGVPKDLVSNFMKERKGEGNDFYSKDPLKVMKAYVNSMAHAIAMKPAIDEYNNNFLPAITEDRLPGLLSRQKADPTTHLNYMKQMFDRGMASSKLNKNVSRVINARYKALNWAPVVSAKHALQAGCARMKISSAGAKIASIIRNINDPDIDKAIQEGTTSDLSDKFNDASGQSHLGGMFGAARKYSVGRSISYGMGEHVVNSDVFKAAKAKGMSDVEATVRALADADTKQQALTRGRSLMQETQFSTNPAYRSEIMNNNNPLLRGAMMFKKFGIDAASLAWQSLVKTGDTRAMSVMKRGMGPDASIAENYAALKELNSNVMPKLIDAYPEKAEILKKGQTFLKQQIKEYDKLLQKAEPLTRGKALRTYAKLMAFGTLLDYGWGLAGTSVKQQVGSSEAKDPSLLRAAEKNAPLIGEANRFQTQGSALGTLPGRSPGDIVNYIPIARAINSAIPGNPLSTGVNNFIKYLKK